MLLSLFSFLSVKSPSPIPPLTPRSISLDPTNSVLYTNHSKALLKLARYSEAVASSEAALDITPHNMKAWYNIAQARHAMKEYEKALHSVGKAREECVREGGKMVSLPHILELGLKCRKEWWEEKERRRTRERPGLLGEVLGLMEREERARVEGKEPDEVQKVSGEWAGKKEELERVFRLVETMGKEGRRREMPDWAVDGITFNVMTDPVVVSFLSCCLVKVLSFQHNFTLFPRGWLQSPITITRDLLSRPDLCHYSIIHYYPYSTCHSISYSSFPLRPYFIFLFPYTVLLFTLSFSPSFLIRFLQHLQTTNTVTSHFLDQNRPIIRALKYPATSRTKPNRPANERTTDGKGVAAESGAETRH
jgi:STIP1 family protein 1